MKKHIMKKHSDPPSPDEFTCLTCQKTFRHEQNLMFHQKSCGKVTKKFKCPHPGFGKVFTRKAMMEHHRDHDHQTGSGLKRKVEDKEGMGKKYLNGEVPELPETVSAKSLRPDKEVSAAKGSKVDSFFYPQTKSEQKDWNVLVTCWLRNSCTVYEDKTKDCAPSWTFQPKSWHLCLLL